MIYLDHAATTPVPRAVADAMYEVLTEQFGNPSSQYPMGLEMKRRVEVWRKTVADALGCGAKQLFFTSAADILLDCFSPLALEEFRRVLRPGGHFLYVVPGPDHLWELKQVLYDRPYPNEEKETPYEGFAYQSIVPVEGTITLPCQADIRALFQMTPYYWKTPKTGAKRLADLESLTTRISFRIHIFQKL